ncbi:MAG: 3-keto-disaccharide hydrolase, partial [Gemmataceae bacterium]
MKRILLSLLLTVPPPLVAADKPATLFNGKDFAGWDGDTKNTWRIEDGVIVGGSLTDRVPRNEFLCTKKTFGDFELKVEFKLLGDRKSVNAGVQFRTRRIPMHHEVSGYQADIGQGYWGALYDESRRNKVLAAPAKAAVEKVIKHDDWNQYTVRAEGPRVRLWLNGTLTVDYTEDDPKVERDGVIGLQVHGGAKAQVFYRNVTIRELKPAAPPAPPGFTALFNGTDLAGWHGMPHFNPYDLDKMSAEERQKKLAEWTADAKKHWKADAGELVNDGDGAYLTTDREYGDVELLMEYKTVAQADSGIYLRATPQVQIWDTTKAGGKWDRGAEKGSGGLFNNDRASPGRDPLVLADRPFGEWNAFRIVQVGERTTVYLNGKLVVDHARMENFWDRKRALRRTGPIQLQTHGGEIRWRNVSVREIPAEEANKILRDHAAAGFTDAFNGKDFAGWTGARDSYEVKDGAIVCKPKQGGNLHTAAEYDDFVARVEYKLPAGGNNGLAVRYPGKGQPSQVAMCEVQLLDDDAPVYKKLDPRQFNGSVYGMIPAQRGYLRPVGEWNFIEVTVRGPAIRVELNGTRVVDGDVSKVTSFMGDKEVPGRLRTKGYFGFAGHSDPVAFRLV